MFQLLNLPLQIILLLLRLLLPLLRLLEGLSSHVELRYLGPEKVVDHLQLVDACSEAVVSLDEAIVGLRRLEVSVVLRGSRARRWLSEVEGR